MKKLITLLAIAIAIPSMVKAQGTVNFASGNASQIVTIQSTGLAAGAGVATAALFWGTTSVSNSLVQIGATTQNLGAGFLSGGTRTTGPETAGGTTAFFQVRAWTGGYLNWDAAYAAALLDNNVLLAVTTIFQNGTGNPTPPATTPAPLTGWTSGPLALAPIPEPSTIALGILGAGSLLFLRRKK